MALPKWFFPSYRMINDLRDSFNVTFNRNLSEEAPSCDVYSVYENNASEYRNLKTSIADMHVPVIGAPIVYIYKRNKDIETKARKYTDHVMISNN